MRRGHKTTLGYLGKGKLLFVMNPSSLYDFCVFTDIAVPIDPICTGGWVPAPAASLQVEGPSEGTTSSTTFAVKNKIPNFKNVHNIDKWVVMIVRMKSLMKIGNTLNWCNYENKNDVDSDFDACSPQQHLCLVGNRIPQESRRCTAGFPHCSCRTSILKKQDSLVLFSSEVFFWRKIFALPVQIKTDRSKSSSSQHQKEEKSRGGCGHRPEFSYWIILVRLQRTCVVYVISLYCSYIDSNGFVIQLIAFPEGKSRS